MQRILLIWINVSWLEKKNSLEEKLKNYLGVSEGFHFSTSASCALLTAWVWDLTKSCAKLKFSVFIDWIPMWVVSQHNFQYLLSCLIWLFRYGNNCSIYSCEQTFGQSCGHISIVMIHYLYSVHQICLEECTRLLSTFLKTETNTFHKL